jgi:hypothetical protein
MHFDLRAPGAVADEVIRLEKLSATVLERHQHHTVTQDPEGTEFCVEPDPARAPDGRIARSWCYRNLLFQVGEERSSAARPTGRAQVSGAWHARPWGPLPPAG